eukprot:5048206-Pleurochrysis_carterae.AAC.5
MQARAAVSCTGAFGVALLRDCTHTTRATFGHRPCLLSLTRLLQKDGKHLFADVLLVAQHEVVNDVARKVPLGLVPIDRCRLDQRHLQLASHGVQARHHHVQAVVGAVIAQDAAPRLSGSAARVERKAAPVERDGTLVSQAVMQRTVARRGVHRGSGRHGGDGGGGGGGGGERGWLAQLRLRCWLDTTSAKRLERTQAA